MSRMGRIRPSVCARVGLALGIPMLTGGCVELPERPQSLDQPGVRMGSGWLQATRFHEDPRLGSITQIVRRGADGDLAIVGTRAALFLPAHSEPPRLVEFGAEAGHAELVEWPDGGPRFLDRGAGGWQTGALIGPDGVRLWQPASGMGMNDLAAGDLDGDGVPEFAVGYNGGGGVRLLDAAGHERWRELDGNVWHVEILDADGDGHPEIVHSNAAGQVTVRDAAGKVLTRGQAEGYFSHFSVVRWPPERTGLLQSGDGRTDVLDLDGRTRVRLETPDTSFLGEARGAVARLGGTDHLVVATSLGHWERTELFVFDEGDVLRYREVLRADCVAITTAEPEGFLLGCGARVLRYAPAGPPDP